VVIYLVETNISREKLIFIGRLKVSFFSDQWSPINQDGKKQYDRQFLLQLQVDPLSMVCPANLPNMEIIRDKSIPSNKVSNVATKDWMPGFIKTVDTRVLFLSIYLFANDAHL